MAKTPRSVSSMPSYLQSMELNLCGRSRSRISRFDLTAPPRQIENVLISTLLAQALQRLFELVQIFPVLATRSTTLHDLLRQRLWILGPEELWVVWQADVYEALDRVRDARRLCVVGGSNALHRRAHVLIT